MDRERVIVYIDENTDDGMMWEELNQEGQMQISVYDEEFEYDVEYGHDIVVKSLQEYLSKHDKQIRKEVVGELIVDIRSLFNSYASSLIDYCIWNKNSDENQKLYNNFKRIINDRLKKVLELFDKRIDKIQGETNET